MKQNKEKTKEQKYNDNYDYFGSSVWCVYNNSALPEAMREHQSGSLSKAFQYFGSSSIGRRSISIQRSCTTGLEEEEAEASPRKKHPAPKSELV